MYIDRFSLLTTEQFITSSLTKIISTTDRSVAECQLHLPLCTFVRDSCYNNLVNDNHRIALARIKSPHFSHDEIVSDGLGLNCLP